MTSEKLTICVHKLLCPADLSDLLTELRKSTHLRRKSRCKPTYSRVVPAHISWCQLQALIDTKVSLGGFDADIEYIDDEGDRVAIGGDDELSEAVKVGLQSDNKELRLLLYHFKRKSKSAEMIRRNSHEKTENHHKPLVRLRPARPITAVNCDSESGEKSPPELVAGEPPKWFVNYMEKFKTDITQDITDRVTKKTVKRLAHALPDLTDGRGKDRARDAPKKTVVHDATCDVCDKSILGVRYKCGNCDDFDLCDQCESDENIHDPDHVFIKIKRPVRFSGRRKGRLVPLLKKSIYHVDPMKEIRRIAKMPIVEPIDICERYGRRHYHEKRTEKLKRRHETQRDAPYKREKLTICSWLKAQESAETLVMGAKFKEPYGCTFVRDESIPDETRLAPGTKFTKKWLMRNTGLHAWDDNVEFVMLWGSLPVVEPKSCRTNVPHLAPDEDATISVEMVAPDTAGSYQNTWSLQHRERCFGHRVWCTIIVEKAVEQAGEEVAETRTALQSLDQAEYEVVEGDTETNEESGEVCIIQRKEDELEESMSYEIVKNEEDLLKVPVAKASQTATPNNTPLASSPPKSPAPELELAARRLVVSTSLEAVAERCEKECQEQGMLSDMAKLSLKEASVDIESYSEDSDSDSDYYVVPLPQCFDVSTPLTRSTVESTFEVEPRQEADDCCSEKSFDLVSHESHDVDGETKETALKLGYDLADEQPEIELQDLSDKREDDEEVFVDSNDELPEACGQPQGSPVVVKNEDSGEEVVFTDHTELVLRAPVPPEMHLVQETTEELDVDQTLVKTPVGATVEPAPARETAVVNEMRSCENGELIHRETRAGIDPQRSTPSSPGLEDFVNAAFEAAGSAASSAIHAAKDVVSMLKQRSQYVPPQSQWTPPNQQYMPRPANQWTPPTAPPVQRGGAPSATDDDLYSDVSDDENVYPIVRDMTAMETLFDMGFANREVNERLLKLYDNDINKVVTEILNTEGADWHEHRH